MSQKTNFKRLALVVVSALGFGLLSTAPSSAVGTNVAVAVTNGSASVTSGAANETTTAATMTVSAYLGVAGVAGDSLVVSVKQKDGTNPTGGSAVAFRFGFAETGTSGNDSVTSTRGGASLSYTRGAYASTTLWDSQTAVAGSTASASYQIVRLTGSGAGNVSAKFLLVVETSTTRVAGTYTFNVQVDLHDGGSSTVTSTKVEEFTFTINDTAANIAAASGTIDSSKTTAVLNEGTDTDATSDETFSALATSGNTTRGTIVVKTYTSDSLAAPESITVTVTGPGLVGTSATGVYGKSITVAGSGNTSILIRSDGTAGVGSFVVATTTRTFNAKTVSFYAAAPSTVTLAVNKPVIGTVSTDDVIRATIKDADGVSWAGEAYIYSTTTTIASSATPALCTYNATLAVHLCPVTGKLAGTASLKVIDADAVADATLTSDAAEVRVSQGVATTATISFDKASYAPGEKALMHVKVLDENGAAMPEGTYSNVFTAAPSPSSAFGAGSATLTASPVLAGATSAVSETTAGAATYVVYMPNKSGTLTVTAIGSTGLAAAGRVAVSGSATVVDDSNDAAIEAATAANDAALEAIDAANAATDAANLAAEAADAATVAAEEARDAADAATAAVEALAGEVATLMAALKAQITTLAKTVAKIAKKVKA